MRYTVVWRREAEDKLAEIWMDANDRTAVTLAAAAIERKLRDDPDQQGQEFYGDHLLVEDPLAVVFQVREGDRVAYVIDVWTK
jgi:hypothetical protein